VVLILCECKCASYALCRAGSRIGIIGYSLVTYVEYCLRVRQCQCPVLVLGLICFFVSMNTAVWIRYQRECTPPKINLPNLLLPPPSLSWSWAADLLASHNKIHKSRFTINPKLKLNLSGFTRDLPPHSPVINAPLPHNHNLKTPSSILTIHSLHRAARLALRFACFA